MVAFTSSLTVLLTASSPTVTSCCSVGRHLRWSCLSPYLNGVSPLLRSTSQKGNSSCHVHLLRQFPLLLCLIPHNSVLPNLLTYLYLRPTCDPLTSVKYLKPSIQPRTTDTRIKILKSALANRCLAS